MKFDKNYKKGAKIPESVIAKEMINKLLRCGALAVETTAESDNKLEETKPNQEESDNELEETKSNQEESDNELEETKLNQEESDNELEESEQNTEKTEQTPRQQTEEQLLQYKKEELEQMAKDKGIEVKQSMTKAEIVALLLQKE